MTAFRGIWPILYAFFGPDGRLDRAAMRQQVRACIAGGAHGVAVLGLATEVSKLTEDERRAVVAWAAEDLAGRLPLAVTIFGQTVGDQLAAIVHAKACGAALAILQPPGSRTLDGAELAAFFGRIMASTAMPVGLQNAPEYLGVGLGPAHIAALARAHGHFVVLKGEGPATLIERLVAETGDRLAIFNGRGGLELPDVLRAGAAGMIPALDCFDVQVRIEAAWRGGNDATAESLYREILPAIVFVMQSIDSLVTYGKRLLARRLALDVFDRQPARAVTPFGLAAIDRFAARLGPLDADGTS